MRSLLLVAVLVGLPMQAQAELYDGNDLVRYMRDWEKVKVGHQLKDVGHRSGLYVGYVGATHDAYQSDGVICPSAYVTGGQVQAIVAAYLKANPKRWNEPATSLVREALTEAFPCQ